MYYCIVVLLFKNDYSKLKKIRGCIKKLYWMLQANELWTITYYTWCITVSSVIYNVYVYINEILYEVEWHILLLVCFY